MDHYHFCTYFDQNYLARGLVLYRSLTRHADPFVLHVLCFDDDTYRILKNLDYSNLRPISLQEFERGDDALLSAKQNRSQVEYYFTCTPSLPLYIFNHYPDVDLVTYLDADLYFYSSPAPIYDELGNQSILIVEHRFPERFHHLEKFGIYNVGLLAFRNDRFGKECLAWWRERCIEWCYDRTETGRFADQKYLDDWAVRFSQVVVLQHQGAGLAPWNVARYTLRENAEAVFINSDPLVFYHFHHLRRIAPFLYDPGLRHYDIQIGSILLKRIYAPYLRELQYLTWQTSDGLLEPLRYQRGYSVRELLRVLVYNGSLLAISSFVINVHLEPMVRPLLKLRKVILSQFQDERTNI